MDESERKKKQDNASAEMGTLMLQGWAMLEDVCLDCHVPIMRSRDKKTEKCVVCDQEYKKNLGTMAKELPATKQAEPRLAEEGPPQIVDKVEEDADYAKMIEEYTGKRPVDAKTTVNVP